MAAAAYQSGEKRGMAGGGNNQHQRSGEISVAALRKRDLK